MKISLLALCCGAVLQASVVPHGIVFRPINDLRDFPEATQPQAIQYACASDAVRLETFFAQRGLPFEAFLVRRRGGNRACHIQYEPTLPGFRALPDDAPIRRLFGSIDPDAFVAGRKPVGDSLDVIKHVLRSLPRPIDVTLSVTKDFGSSLWPRRLEDHFPLTEHRITLRPSEAEHTHPWAQDYVKAGEVRGQASILAPRRLFEGRAAEGERFQPLLAALDEPGMVQSKLSWEGGDLQIASDPRDPARRILFYGSAVRQYWGKRLSREEFGYVLRVEFGADHAVDLSEIDAHADFLVGFLPQERIALVAEPVRSSVTIARAAAAELAKLYGDRASPASAVLQARLASGGRSTLDSRVPEILAALEPKLLRVPPSVATQIAKRLESYVDAHCPGRLEGCFAGEGKRHFFSTDAALLQAGLNVLADAEVRAKLAPALLGLIEAYWRGEPRDLDGALNRKAAEISALGYRVVRAPYLIAPGRRWAGVSYVNFLLFDRTVFVPKLGLGEAESAIFERMQADIGGGYEVVPVGARLGLLHNGGIHCVFGIERAPVH